MLTMTGLDWTCLNFEAYSEKDWTPKPREMDLTGHSLTVLNW